MGCLYLGKKIQLTLEDIDIEVLSNNFAGKDESVQILKSQVRKIQQEETTNQDDIDLDELRQKQVLNTATLTNVINIYVDTHASGPLKQPRNKSDFDLHYSEIFLSEINSIRRYPKLYANKLASLIKYIIPIKKHKKSKSNVSLESSTSNQSNFIFAFPNAEKVSLPSGENSFRIAIDFLEKITVTLNNLTWNDEIKLQTDNCEEFNQGYLKKLIEEKKNIIKGKYPYFCVSLDAIKNPEVSAILQVVDDNPFQGHRRNLILNDKLKYLAVSEVIDKSNNYFALICFA